MERHPFLSSEGFEARLTIRRPGGRTFEQDRADMTHPAHVAEFVRAAQWLAYAPKGKGTVRRRRTSYGWKHIASAWHERHGQADSYISNGMFLAAAYALGRKVVQAPDSPNGFMDILDRAERWV